MAEYSYPDPGEVITLTMIDEVTGDERYWAESEVLALSAARRVIHDRIGLDRNRSALDVGTGEGRLLPWLAGLASEIHAQDPDRDRLEMASKAWASLGRHDTTVTFEAGPVPHVRPGGASLILCSHVFQHVTDTTRRELISAISDAAATDAIFVTSFSHGTERGTYTLERVRGSELDVKQVDRETFESHSTGQVLGGPDALPIHYLLASDVAEELRAGGWEELLRWEYHVLHPDGRPSLADDLIANARQHSTLPQRARDVLMVFGRTSHGG